MPTCSPLLLQQQQNRKQGAASSSNTENHNSTSTNNSERPSRSRTVDNVASGSGGSESRNRVTDFSYRNLYGSGRNYSGDTGFHHHAPLPPFPLPSPAFSPNRFPPLNWASVASWFFRPDCPPLLPPPPPLPPPASTGPMTSFSTASSSAAVCTTTSSAYVPRPCAPLPPHVPSSTSTRVSTTSTSTSSSSSTRSELHGEFPKRVSVSVAGADRVMQAPTICSAIRCTVPGCSCDCFVPGKRHLRYCDTCKHGWVPHALDKLGSRHLYSSHSEPVQANVAFDIASLVLYGCQALPIRLKILLDRLFSVLQRDQVVQILQGFGWNQEDYARGYILQESQGGVLDKWSICSPEEEPLVLQQFLRFGETRPITQQLLLAQQVALAQEHHQQQAAAASNSAAASHSRALERLLPPPPRPEESRTGKQHNKAASPVRSTRVMSPSRRPSPPAVLPPPPLHLGLHHHHSRHPATQMSPHQKHSPLNFLKLPSANGPIAATTSPPSSINSSPLSISPLNRLQNMQPFDFRKLGAGLASFPTSRVSPEMPHRRRESDHTSGLNLSIANSLPFSLPPPPPPTHTTVAMSIANSLSHSAAAMAAAVSANPLAASLVASSFPGLLPSTRIKSPLTNDFLSGGGSSDFGSEDDDADENSQSALNLSRDREMSKSPRQQRPGHVRKATTPTKRHWGSSTSLPLNLGTQFINPATGKKRVQCNVCLKTFCDKGALKIHFSAVHLREMHKCTVEGCNMMFSSRRSRNRHSANPNPKLHSPHLRRKISPHDGRSAQAHPILIPPQSGLIPAAALNSLNPFNPFPLLTPPPELRHHHSLAAMDFKHSLDLSMQRMDDAKKEYNTASSEDGAPALTTSSTHDEEDEFEDDGIVVVGGDEDDEPERTENNEVANGVSDQPEDFSMPSKRTKISISDVDEDMASNVDSNEDSLSVVDSHSLKDETSPLVSSKRKRKSQHPTRCAVPVLMEETSLTDGDNSNDHIVFPEPQPEQLEPEELTVKKKQPIEEVKPKSPEIKIKSEKSDDEMETEVIKNDFLETRKSPDVNANEKSEDANIEVKNEICSIFPLELKKEKSHTDSNDNEEISEDKDNRPPSSTESNKSDESLDSSNALRQLESLSHGHFGDLMSRGLNLSMRSTPPHFPPLGFMMDGGPPSPARSHTSSVESSNGDSPSDDNSENQIYGHFDNGTFISTMDVPIDKDNPRKCTACGKVFQNHFGVKTHYQNVHLKLMHKCNVDGCNAAFPSKRSRDRHSANLNLHRKLLSTSSSDKPGGSLFEKSPFASLAANPALHNEFLARLYADSQGLPLNLDSFKGHHLPPLPGSLAEQILLNGDRVPPPPLLLPPLGSLANFPGLTSFANHLAFPPNLNGLSGLSRKERSSESNSPMSVSSPPSTSPAPSGLIYSVEDEVPIPDSDGMLPCRLCRKPMKDLISLKDHCEQTHMSELYKCPVSGCPRMFISRTRRNIHAQNEALHSSSVLRRRGSDSNCS